MISIIIATLNCESLIESTLNSIKSQNNNKVQLIIKDGLSSDNTLLVVNKFKKKNNIDLLIKSKKDYGIYNAWNQAMIFVKYNWIMFLGAGDILREKTIDNYIKNIDFSYDIIFSKIFIVNGSSYKSIEQTNPRLRNFMNIPHPSILHNKQFLKQVGEFDESLRIAGDYELLLRKEIKHKFCDFYSVEMLYGGISTKSTEVFKEVFEIQNKYFPNRKIQNFLNFLISITKYFIKKHLNVS